jgi:hypothetical protein
LKVLVRMASEKSQEFTSEHFTLTFKLFRSKTEWNLFDNFINEPGELWNVKLDELYYVILSSGKQTGTLSCRQVLSFLQ